jgi:type I restriction enzyme, R subunit
MSFTEYKTVEKEILDTLQTPDLGWRYMHGDQVTREYRGNDEQEMLVIPVLREYLKALNPGVLVDDTRTNVVMTRLRALRDNQEWISWLRGEQTTKFGPDENAQTIRLIDFDNPDRNDFLVSNQVWVQGIERRRPDILLYINGIPVVDIEAKTAARGHVDWAEGAKQCDRYDREIPQLYASNCFCAGVNELRMKYGVPGSLLQYWQQWRDPSPHTQISSFDEMKCTLYGLFDRSNLLDIIANFVVFDVEDGKRVKKVARYQQFRAANKIVYRALALAQPSGERRGIVWHTQGSGKSLTMIFAARKLWSHPKLEQPTLVIVVDRVQLEEQIAGELYGTNTENVAIAATKQDLRALLANNYRGVILTLVHKFDEIEPEMTSRANVIVLVDEAHRTQYGDLGVFMRTAMPNASMFGFTGTPIELSDRHTPRAFGKEHAQDQFERYMDRYSIEDSIRDGATKPIHYEVRLTDWTVAHAELDTKFEKLFADRSEEERRLLMGEAKLDAILKHPRRIAQVASDVAGHFVEHVRPNRFKAMVVCRDKEACVLYKVALDAALQEWLGGEDLDELTRIVVSEDLAHDPEAVKRHYLGGDRRSAIDDFKQPAPLATEDRTRPEHRFRRTEIFIVCDMLLTGFDAPIVQTMYLDKGMRDHTLLQAIARVNRPYKDIKESGLILDYFGVFEDLNEALNFDKSELGDVAYPFSALRDRFREQITALLALFEGITRDGRHSTLMQALLRMNDDDVRREEFEELFRHVRILFEMLQPDESLRDFLADYTWLVKFYMLYRKKFYPREHFEITPEDGAKTRALIRENVDVKELESDFPSYVLDEHYLTKVEPLKPDAKALDIEAMLDVEIRIRLDEDEDVRPLSERLDQIIEHKRAGTLAGIALLKELEDLTSQVVQVVQEAQRPVVESIAQEVAKRIEAVPQDTASAVAKAMVARAGELCFPNWYAQTYMDTELYRELTIVLVDRFKDLNLHGPGRDFVERCIRLLKKVRFVGEAPG